MSIRLLRLENENTPLYNETSFQVPFSSDVISVMSHLGKFSIYGCASFKPNERRRYVFNVFSQCWFSHKEKNSSD